MAIDKVRSIGNIGAHVERDINLIVDVDPDEAQILIEPVEMLFDEWYVASEKIAALLLCCAVRQPVRLQSVKDLLCPDGCCMAVFSRAVEAPHRGRVPQCRAGAIDLADADSPVPDLVRQLEGFVTGLAERGGWNRGPRYCLMGGDGAFLGGNRDVA